MMKHFEVMNYQAGIKLLTLATAVRWIGWGFVEALLPIFLYSFSKTYADSGILKSTYDIIFMLTVPIAGALADRISSRTVVLAALTIYPFIGMSYFLAGLTGGVIFIVLARIMNGLSFSLDSVGRATYFRRIAPAEKSSEVFGFFDTFSNLGWLAAVLASIYLVSAMPIYWIFLGIAPTSLIAFIIVTYIKPEKPGKFGEGLKSAVAEGVYGSIIREVKSWGMGLRLIGFLNFFFSIVGSASQFFIPIYTFNSGASLQKVILLTVAFSLPALFGIPLGKVAQNLKAKAIFWGLFGFVVMLLGLAITNDYVWQLAFSFGMGFALELAGLATGGMATKLINAEHYGRLSSTMSWIANIGSLIAPIFMGYLIDKVGLSSSFLTLSMITAGILGFAWIKRRWLRESTLEKVKPHRHDMAGRGTQKH